jgi:hypothetical protein
VASDGICPGSCNNDYRRRKAIWEAATETYAARLELLREGDPVPDPPQAPDLRPWYGEPVWCMKCHSVIRSELAELDDVAAMVDIIPPLDRLTAKLDGMSVDGTPEERTASPKMDTLEELGDWARQWEAIIRGREFTAPRRGYLATQTTTVIAWLTSHLDDVLANADVSEDFGTEVRRWHRELSRRASAGQMSKHLKKPCPRCNLYTLWVTIGEDYVRCIDVDCSRLLSREEYDSLPDAA